MATTTVKVLAKELKRTAADLLEQLKAAGIEKSSENESITEKDKTVLLEHLQKAHGNAEAGARKKITLIKRENSEIRQADSAGRTRTVQVEVRKKRVLVKAGEKVSAAEDSATKAAPATASKKPILSEEELEKRAAEATRQAELLARQEAEMKAAEDARQKEAAQPVVEKDAKGDEAPAAAEKKAQSEKAAKELAASKEKELAEIRVRRAAAEAEALAIRDMMSAPARVLKAPSEIAADEAKKGTLHKPAKAEGAEDKKKSPAKVGGKTIKSSETSSTWQEEGVKKPGGLKTRGDVSGGVGGWRSGSRSKRRHQFSSSY
jgi:translation initiation factor IF-2